MSQSCTAIVAVLVYRNGERRRTMTAESPEAMNACGRRGARYWVWPVVVAGGCWFCIAIGFVGLKILMGERPQFAGRQVRFAKTELVQESPRIVFRKVRDDVSVCRAIQAARTDINFNMRARRDYRGLRTIIDMAGGFVGSYTVANPSDEGAFVLFKCSHPRSALQHSNLNASALKLDADGPGIAEDTGSAWVWTGELGPGEKRRITVSYRVAGVMGIKYEIADDRGDPIKAHCVTVGVEDLPAMVFTSSDGEAQPVGNRVVWERSDFLPPEAFSARIAETRSLYAALNQLLDVGPLISLLFMVATLAVMLSRPRGPTALQVITIAAGYSFYFPLILYLSARFTFPVAMAIAVVAPGALLVNYTRVAFGARVGLIGGIVFLALYQVFPTLGAFAGWNRGMVLLCLGMVTLSVLINLQNRALRRAGGIAAALLFMAVPGMGATTSQCVRVVVPGEIVAAGNKEPVAQFGFGVAEYELRLEEHFAAASVSLPVEVLRVGENGEPLFDAPVHLLSHELPTAVRLIAGPELFRLKAMEEGGGVGRFDYRCPLTRSGKHVVCSVPLLRVPSGRVTLVDRRADIEFTGGSVWSKAARDDSIRYDVGVVGGGELVLKVAAGDSADGGPATVSTERLYGIGVTESQQLTVLNSDGTCTHFAEFRLPAFHPGTFELELPATSKVISASVNGCEIDEPVVRAGRCTIPIEGEHTGGPRQVSLRLAMPPVRLGFIGEVELEVPRPAVTIGTLGWTIAFPPEFDTQVESSGLDDTGQIDLNGFGDYGRVLQTRPRISLGKTLVPPGVVKATVKYRQVVKGMTEGRLRDGANGME